MADTKTVEERLDALEKSNKELSTKNDALTKSVDKLTNTNKQLTEAHGNLAKENTAIKAELKKASAKPEDVKVVEKPKVPTTTFTVAGKTYKFVLAQFWYKKDKVTAVDALNDEAILVDLVGMKSGAVVEVA